MDLDNTSLTFLEYMKAYEGHTPETFHKMCDMTGMGSREEASALAWIRRKWQEHEDNIIPF